MKISKKEYRKRGFTLIELLVVIAMVAVLAAISLAMVFRFRKSADKTIALGNMRQIQAANVSYSADHSGRLVSPTDTVGGLPVEWFENPEFVSQLKSEEATYDSGGLPNVELPLSLMDPAVVREREAGYEELDGSYAYNVEGMPEVNTVTKGFLLSQVADPARTAAFFTAGSTAAGRVSFAQAGNIAYRHEKKAIVVFYDSHAVPMSEQEISKMNGDATGTFWDANPNDNP